MNLASEDAKSTTPEFAHAHHRRAGLLLLALAYAMYLLPFMRIMLPRTDEGTFLSGAERIVHGQVFARDFLEVMGPGTFYWLALFFKVFGSTFFAARLCLFISWMLSAILVYLLSRRLMPRHAALPVIFISTCYFNALGTGISHHIDSNCIAFASIFCAAVWMEKGRQAVLMASGGLAAITTSIHQPKGILLGIAIAACILLVPGRLRGWSFAVFSIGYGAVLGAITTYFLDNRALQSLILANFIWPFQHYSAINEVPYAYGTIKFCWRGGLASGYASVFQTGLATLLIAPFFLVVIVPFVVLLQAFLSHRIKRTSPEILLYLACGFAIWIAELHRKDIVHLVFGSPVLIILCVYFMSLSSRRYSKAALLALSVCVGCLATCNLLAVLTAHSRSTRVGTVALFEQGDEIAALQSHVPSGAELFVYPYCPSYYFLAGAINPTRYSILQDGYNTSTEFHEVVGNLEARKTQFVLWDTEFRTRSQPLVFPAAQRLPKDSLFLEVYLETHYRSVFEQKGLRIMERNQ